MKQRWFWGTFFLVSAIILITSQLGLFGAHIGIWTLFFTIALIAIFVTSLRHLIMSSLVFSLAFLAIIYAKPLGITVLVPWTILGAALLLSIGLSILIHPRWYYRYHHHGNWAGNFDHERPSSATINDPNVNLDLSMSNTIRYIHSTDFEGANIHVSMGGAKIYFDDVQLHQAEATIAVDISLSSVELYVPKTWQLHLNVNNSLGDIQTQGTPTTAGPVVYLQGRVSLGQLTINYI
ncbi:hypothetical protein RA086_06240 [Lactiplantibacillus sp. WILCCON 0030]|uniref:LiaF transmembrane domain-containing protein n=1 Tax=Lactiplantibacillus brownii TaxID=3069269 RepID=A0ABU1A8G2_9LACO|nr:hypothetical protein [Lactiplantibacillus brownii]MDQ7937225.1 hypothetical protein [Lactiplantibacillus brownii]